MILSRKMSITLQFQKWAALMHMGRLSDQEKKLSHIQN